MDIKTGLARYRFPLAMGALTAAFYGTIALAPLYLVPLQIAATNRGHHTMRISSVFAALLITVWQIVLLSRAGAMSAGTLALGLSAPAAMILALVLMALPRFERIPFAIRALAGGALASLVCLPSFIAAAGDEGVKNIFMAAFSSASSAVGAEVPDTEALWSAIKTGVASSFGAIVFIFLFASAWIGSRLGSFRRTIADGDIPTLKTYHLPVPLLWFLLGAWAALLVNRFYPSFVLSAVALNATTALSICYGVQGLAIANALAERAGLAPVARLIMPLVLILLVASGIAGFIAIGVLALLGTLETWIPFRTATSKGDTP
ncbi:MAG TPA: hypothetical protein VMX33_10995 [bacterium]|nr:hypothetical protein [bacterium]